MTISTLAEAYSEPFQTYSVERFAKIVNRFWPLNIFEKCSILDTSHGSKYSPALAKWILCMVLSLSFPYFLVRFSILLYPASHNKSFSPYANKICYHEVIEELLPYVSHANLEIKQHNQRKDQVKFVEYKI